MMIKQYTIKLPHFERGFHLITHKIKEVLKELPEEGVLNIFLKHTSAGLTINENADPDVLHDINYFANKIVPDNDPGYLHILEGSDDMPAHIKSSLFSVSLNIPIRNRQLDLGVWQGIYLCEFRNYGGSRNLTLTVFY